MVTTETTPSVSLDPKAKLSGRVVKTTLAGALIDVGQPIPGVLHISQIQKDPVNKVEDVIKEGQAVDVWVRKVRKDRIELTMIQPLMYEWKDLQPEMVVKGKVIRIETYGAFIDIGAERPGMIHISELAQGYVKNAGDVVKEGQEIEAAILNVDRKKRQIRLSMKALQPEIVEEEKPARENKRGGRKNKKAETEISVEETSTEPELTGMQIAWQMAQERARHDKDQKTKRIKSASAEQEELLSRTLKKRLPTGA
ncbi:MAG: S1 RNA-binding domain-containing protein [Chloroflexi bacterium]|nr:S1 RNA-binding domain-containing protein [Chloroflexota bacterium]MBI3339282.1 S1 RNA-binding domain-containing protein [Chloroflexota bacterium]